MPKPKQQSNEPIKPPKYEGFLDLTKTTNIQSHILDKIIGMMQRLRAIKQDMGVAIPKKITKNTKYPDGSGLLGESDNLRNLLRDMQYELGVTGFRFGDMTYCCELRNGRQTLDPDKLKEELLSRFIPVTKKGTDVLKIINESFKEATKQGEDFFEREFAIISEGD